MKKINDRLLLGAIAGLGGNLVKTAIMNIAIKKRFAEINGFEKAAGMLIQPFEIADTRGKIVGYIADTVMAGILGVTTTYMLSFTGKNHAALKGGLYGQAMWTVLYGVMATMGATKVEPVSPKTVLSEFVAHTAYGAVTAELVSRLGEPALFDGTIPLSSSPVQAQEQPQTRL